MLYERWSHVGARQPHVVALRDLSTGRQWTFGELHATGEKWNGAPASGTASHRNAPGRRPALQIGQSDIVYLQGHTPEFIFGLLNAWRIGKIVCPIEPGQTPLNMPPPPATCVHLKTTSATTGAARYVAFTESQLAADAENVVATMGLRPDWPNLGVISMAHSYGFSNLVLPLLLHGIPLILVPSPLPEAVRRVAGSENAVTLAAVPALWRAWLEAKSILPSVKLAISAGAPLPASLEQAVFNSTGLKIHNFYGSTECGGIAYDTTDEPRTDDACVGSPMQNVDLSVNNNGCLVVRSRAVGESYWPQPDTNLGGGCFQTSDLAEIVSTERGRSRPQRVEKG